MIWMAFKLRNAFKKHSPASNGHCGMYEKLSALPKRCEQIPSSSIAFTEEKSAWRDSQIKSHFYRIQRLSWSVCMENFQLFQSGASRYPVRLLHSAGKRARDAIRKLCFAWQHRGRAGFVNSCICIEFMGSKAVILLALAIGQLSPTMLRLSCMPNERWLNNKYSIDRFESNRHARTFFS